MTPFARIRERKRADCARLRTLYDDPRPDQPTAWQGNLVPLYDRLQPPDGSWAHAILIDPVLPHDVAECIAALTRMSDAGFARMPGGPAGTSASRFFFFRAGAS